MKRLLIFLVLSFAWIVNAQGQCGGGTPSFYVDLSADPNATWLSSSVVRNDTCCGPDGNCIQFIVLLSPLAEGVIFNVVEGALPGGALFYQIDCGAQTQLNAPICLYGEGPHSITFCKPGNNENVYSITSVAEPGVDDELSITEGCLDSISTIGFEPSTIEWNSVFPGALGDYNSYLDCTIACEQVLVTPSIDPPPYVDYQICGLALGSCDPIEICDTVRVFFHDSLEVAIEPINPMVCHGGTNTTITATVEGGSSAYHYLWNTGDTTQSIDVGVGNYSVSVIDDEGCYPMQASITVGEFFDDITANAGNDLILCDQSSSISLTGILTGVSTGYWYGGDGNYLPDSSALTLTYQPSATEFAQGFVDLWLLTTNTANCPPDSDMVHIEISPFIANISALIDSVSCFGLNDGSIDLIIDQGFDPYTFLWDDPSSSTDSAISGLIAGDYTVIISDSISCDTAITFSVYEPEELRIDSIYTIDLSCHNDSSGEAAVFVSGGNNPYTINWLSGFTSESGSVVDGLSAGVESFTVLDSKSCSLDSSLVLSEPNEIALQVDSINAVSCFGGSDGQVYVSAIGGSGTYTYIWDDLSGAQVGANAVNLTSGIYTVVVNDASFCSDSLQVEVIEPLALSAITQVIQNVSCFEGDDGIGEVIISGGASPYTILWDSAAYFQNTSIASGLSAGSYTVMVLDSNNCLIESDLFITQPDSAVNASINTSNVSCFGFNDGQAMLIESGGSPPFQYLWDDQLANQTTQSIDNIAPGSYMAWVYDANACADSIEFTISQPSALSSESIESMVSCFEGSNGYSQIIANGGIPPYEYLWDANTGNQTSATASNLIAGAYLYLVFDANQCVDSGFVTIDQNDPIVIEASEDITICTSETVEISAQASGGSGPYTYFWSDFGQGQIQSINISDDLVCEVIAIDSLGCQSLADSVIVSVINIFNDSLLVWDSGSICEGETTSIEASFSGSEGPYTYSWNQGLGSTYGPLYITPTQSSMYTFNVSDECGNVLTDSTFVEVYPIPNFEILSSINEGCPPLTVSFESTSDQQDLSYIWQFGNGQASADPTPVFTYNESGNYLVQVQAFSPYGCIGSSNNTHYVNVYDVPIANFIATPMITDISEPIIDFTNASSEDALFFTWYFGDGDSIMTENTSHEYLEIGEYLVSLEVENLDGCISEISKTVRIDPDHDVIIPNVFTPSNNGSNGGEYDPEDLSNDVFYPFADYVSDFQMLIFNRWGELIFESKDIAIGWDGYYRGERATLGEYVYTIDIRFIDGYEINRQGKVKILN